MADVWVPGTSVNGQDYVPAFATGPIGLSALFRDPKGIAVQASRPHDWSKAVPGQKYKYYENRKVTAKRLLKVERSCGLAFGELVGADRNRIVFNNTTTMKHSVVIVFSSWTLYTNHTSPAVEFNLLPEALHLLKTNPARFEENYGYYFVSPQTNISQVSMICHIEASSKQTSAWRFMENNLAIEPPGCTAASLAVTIANIRGQAKGNSDMTINIQMVSSGTAGVNQRHFGAQMGNDDVAEAFNRMWSNAQTLSNSHSKPYKVDLKSYRSAFPFVSGPDGTPTDPWPPAHSRLSVPIHTRLTALTAALNGLKAAVELFPSPRRQAHFRQRLAECGLTFGGIKNNIIAAAIPPQRIDDEIHSAFLDCASLNKDIAIWQRRYDFILDLIQARSQENPVPWGHWWVPCGATHDFPFGLDGAPHEDCPISDPSHDPIPVILPAKWYEHYVQTVIPLGTGNKQEIILGYNVRPRKPFNNGWWRMNKAILLRGGGCRFECCSWAQSDLDFEIQYTVGLRSDYDFPELLDPIQRL